jgi:hypothetical protein
MRMGGPDLWYQMAFVDTTVEQSFVSSAEGTRGRGNVVVACTVLGVCGLGSMVGRVRGVGWVGAYAARRSTPPSKLHIPDSREQFTG